MTGKGPIQIGRYVLHDELASGGMASVHFGRLVGTGGFAKTVAIKRLHRLFARQPSFRKMILEEGRLAARIRHPNVVPPLDVLAEGNELLLVMEYVHGESLSRLSKAAVAAGEIIPIAIVAAIMANVLHGLHAAHEAKDESGTPLGIVHRDMSPQNVIIGVDGVARVIDFGIAKAADSDEHTQTGTIKGKVPYLAPEQLDGEQATRRTDIYAAAVCFWEVLAGKRLFSGADEGEVLRNIMSMDVPPPSSLNPNVPGTIDGVVLRGLSRKPEDRYATAREMALEIEAAVHLATATQVGAWVERLAAEALATRAAQLAAVESAVSADAEDQPTASVPRSVPRAPLLSQPTAPTDVTNATAEVEPAQLIPTRPPPPPSARTAPPPPSARTAPPPPSLPRPPPPSVRPPLPAPPPPAPLPMEVAASLSVPTPNQPIRLPAAGTLRKPEVEIPNVQWLPPTAAPPTVESPFAAREPTQSRWLPWLIGLLLLLLGGGWVLLPFAIQRAVVSAGAKRGLDVSVDRVEVTRKAIRLVDVKVESQELPGVSAHAAAVEVAWKPFAITGATVDDLELSVDGAWTDVRARVAKWRAARGPAFSELFADYTQIGVASGRVEWKNVSGVETTLLLENLTGDVTRNPPRLFGDDWRLSVPLVTFQVGAVSAGPWALSGDRIGSVDRIVVRLDPNGTFPASVTWTASDDGSENVDFAIPPTRPQDLHLPPAFLPSASPATRIEARGAVGTVTAQGARTAGGRLAFAATALTVFKGGDAVDLNLDLPLGGDTSGPIGVPGATLSLSPNDPSGAQGAPVMTAKLAGQGDLRGNQVRLQLAGKTNPLPCAGKGLGQCSLLVDIALPFQDLRKGQIGLTPSNVCVPRLGK